MIAGRYNYYARSGESLSPLGLDKLDAIRAQTRITDWSAQTVEAASLADLSTEAVGRARAAFARKYANRSWSPNCRTACCSRMKAGSSRGVLKIMWRGPGPHGVTAIRFWLKQ